MTVPQAITNWRFVCFADVHSWRQKEYDRQRWLKLKQNPERYAKRKEANRENNRKYRQRRLLRAKHVERGLFKRNTQPFLTRSTETHHNS